MSVLIKIILDLEETEQRDRRCARWKGGHAWERRLPWAPQELAQLSRNQPNVKKKIKNQKKSGQYNLQDFQNNMWMSGYLEPHH